MKLLEQTRDSNCGQTCIAMIAGVSIETVEHIMCNTSFTHAEEQIHACEVLGIKLVGGFIKVMDAHLGDDIDGAILPKYCLVSVYTFSGGRHLIVKYGDVYYNPVGRIDTDLDNYLAINRYIEFIEPAQVSSV